MLRYLAKINYCRYDILMHLPLAQLNISNTIWSFEVMPGAVNGHNTRGCKAPGFSIRLVDGIMVDAVATLEERK